jgi:UDP-2,3-diacylglucosamine pyrophosphatase LpxH
LKYWSLSSYLKHKVKKAVNFISDFEQTLVKEAQMRGLDGVICGHIHHAEIREYDGIIYCNTGDWVESHSAIVEQLDGTLELVYWKDFESETEDELQFVNNDVIIVNDKKQKTAAAMAILE